MPYYPRSNFVSLARQYFNHGSGRARTFLKHGGLPGGRQMLPVAALLACLLSLGLAVANPAFSAVAILYALACTTWGLALAIQQRQICAALSGPAAVVMHMSWAIGFVRSVLKRSRCTD
jgi:succinoglycan biosynthesis protein ExoA